MTDKKNFVLTAFDTLFNERDYAAAARFWSPDYIQHSAHIPPGRDGLFNLVRAAPPDMRYENHVAVGDGDYVLLHGRFINSGRARAWVAGDVVRLENGLLIEHWDTLQDEVTQDESKSGLPMFGERFPTAEPALAVEERSKAIALKAIRGVFIERDVRIVEELFAPDYIQHNPTIPNGRDAIAALLGSLPQGFRYEPGMVVAEGSIVMIHGRYVGWAPEPMVAVDIFRVENGRLVEHWDVLQTEVPVHETASQNAMFTS
jgi:predicted SnoaL-like aldol condensation-catalyzing enzyme